MNDAQPMAGPRRWGVILVLSLLLGGLVLGAAPNEKITLRIATGSRNGVYYPLGHGIQRVIETAFPNDVTVEVLETGGSVHNLQLLDTEQAELALVQNDTAYYFTHGEVMFSLPSSRVLAVASLYTELIQIVATKRSGITQVDQLRGRRIRTGSPPADKANSATLIFARDGWESADLTDVRCKFGTAREMLLDGSLDAAFVTAGVPTPLLTEEVNGVSLQDAVNLIPIGEGLAHRLMRAFPYFVYTAIPAQTYHQQNEPVKTVGVRAILVARRGLETLRVGDRSLPPRFIERITERLFAQPDLIRLGHGVPGADLTRYRFDLKDALDGVLDHRRRPIIPLHPEAAAFYGRHGLLERHLSDYWPSLVWAGLCVAAFVFFLRYRRAITQLTQRHLHVRLAIIFVCLYVLGTLAMFFCERYNNRSFETLSESFWSITIYMLSGFEDRYPVTWLGRVISVLIFVLSVFFFGAVAGRFAAVYLRREELKMPKDISGHIVICNWNERGKRVVAEIRHPEGRPEAQVVIVDNKALDEKRLLKMPAFEQVYFIHEDPIRHGTLKSARANMADTVIILADASSPDPDAKSAMIILALLSECKRHRPHIVAEVVNSDNGQHLRDAGANETICTTDIGVGILAHCALNKQLSDVYKDLLSYSFEGNEIYIVPPEAYPESYLGMAFGDCAQMLYQDRESSNPVILLGLRRGDRVIMNPRVHSKEWADRPCRIEAGDALIVMAFSLPNLTT